MVQVINVQNTPRRPSTGAMFGAGFGAGVGEGIAQGSKMMLQAKVNEMFTQREADKNLPAAKILAAHMDFEGDEANTVAQMLARNPQKMVEMFSLAKKGGGTPPGYPETFQQPPAMPSQGYTQPQPQEQWQTPQNTLLRPEYQEATPPMPSSLTPGRSSEPIPMRIARGQVGPQNITPETAAAPRTPSVQESLASVQAPNAMPRAPTYQQPQQTQAQGKEEIIVPEIPQRPDLAKYQADYNRSLNSAERGRIKTEYYKREDDYRKAVDIHNKAIMGKQKQELEKQKTNKASEKDEKFVNDVFKQENASRNLKKGLEEMEEIREKGRLGPFPGLGSPGQLSITGALGTTLWNKTAGAYAPNLQLMGDEEALDRQQYDTDSQDIFQLWKTTFPRGFTQGEFAKYERDYVPNSKKRDSANKGAEKVLRREMELVERQAAITREIIKRNGGIIPKNIAALISEEMAAPIQDFKKNVDKIAASAYAPGDETDDENPTHYPVGTVVEKNGTLMKTDGKKWTKVKEAKSK